MVSTCGPFRFSSDFDSGNFLKVELLENRKNGGAHGIDYEVNLYTRPDCHGTQYENGNRTWFHFAISGGKPSANLKLNILNLNKQVKLFNQGMQPVFRILPEQPYWIRVPDRLVVNETLDHICSISFRQRLPEDTKKSTLYIAFSYPFSYAELREWLLRLDSIFVQSIPIDFKFDRIKLPLPFPTKTETSLASAAALAIENEIYYVRETACYTLERRLVDLITVTSLYGMSAEREERLRNLFPEVDQPRPYRFPTKKVVFLSARVHPGETPSTFVLNGFFKFVLERNDPRAIVLRRLFVFKFMPMLNPDGVAHGHYRTDPRGVNLNRVYLNPSPILHPSIYAARKLLLYYHDGVDHADDYEYPVESQQSFFSELDDVNNMTCDGEKGSQNEDSTSSAFLNVEDSSNSTASSKYSFSGNASQKLQDLPLLLQQQQQMSDLGTKKEDVDGGNKSDDTATMRASKSCIHEHGSKTNVNLTDYSGSVSVPTTESKILSAENSNSSKYTFVLSDSNSLCAGCTISPFEKKSNQSVGVVGKKSKKKLKSGKAAPNFLIDSSSGSSKKKRKSRGGGATELTLSGGIGKYKSKSRGGTSSSLQDGKGKLKTTKIKNKDGSIMTSSTPISGGIGVVSPVILQTEEVNRILIENEMDSSIPMADMECPVTIENMETDSHSHQCAFEACDEDSVLYTSDISSTHPKRHSEHHTLADSKNRNDNTGQLKTVLSEKKETAGPSNKNILTPTKKKEVKSKGSKTKTSAEMFGLTVRKRMDSPEMKLREKTFQNYGTTPIQTRSSSHCKTSRYQESPSGLFLYVDMHGHATKRGIFMYGNHFSDSPTQAECMLLPRLMAMNSQHFDFAACNFTERLMCMKDRKDGMSREGSGRVACLKLTGLVRSYTLECNYNTGRLVNPIISRPSSYGFVDPPAAVNIHHSPKFTPDLFEGSGRALAESLLDLSGQNPWSRLGFSEFKSLENMRKWLINRLNQSAEYNQTQKVTTNNNISTKKSSTSPAITTPSTNRASASSIKTPTKKRSTKKHSNVLVELHPRRASIARGSDTRVIPVIPAVSGTSSGANAVSIARRSSLPCNSYVMGRTKDGSRRDPSAR